MLKREIKKVFPNISWRSPIVSMFYKVLDPIDFIIRLLSGRSELPMYSIRVRSNGVTNQFGGGRFGRMGELITGLLKTHTELNSTSKVLEIGCGCGRTAFALSRVLENGNYTGMDVEKTSIESCLSRPIFVDKEFHFDLIDAHNDQYNPEGSYAAKDYVFPYEDNKFDVIFLVSVFTHMLTDDVRRYIQEISRVLRPGGIAMFTTFLMDKGALSNNLSFPHKRKEHYYYNQKMPEVAIGYQLDFYRNEFSSCGLEQVHDVLWGGWRHSDEVLSETGVGQDIVFVKKV